jgi:ATP-dependent Lon protease
MVALFALKSKEWDGQSSNPLKLYDVGTVVYILKMFRYPDNSMGLMVQGLSRIRLEQITKAEPVLKGKVRIIPESTADSITPRWSGIRDFPADRLPVRVLPDNWARP